MEQHQDTMAMLDLIIQPAFCVNNGVIVHVNKAAAGILLEEGCSVASLLVTGHAEYSEFKDGCLYLTLQHSGGTYGASVVRMSGFDIFVLEDETDHAELKAMALAAQNLREPLSSVMTMANSLLTTVENAKDPAATDQMARLNRGLFQMLRILGNMSDADRYQSNTLSPMETKDIRSFLGELFERLTVMTGHADIELRFSNLNDTLYCLIDTEKLERAIYNIVSNAMKFTPKGGNIEAQLIRRENRLYLTIQDSGTGIPENQRGNVYSRFLRQPGLDDSRQGIGLGMVLIRSAATVHGGTILIEQPKGQGLRLTMTMEIRQNRDGLIRSPGLQVDYAGEWDHSLIELSESLPASVYTEQNK